jgi:hypothetical protein
MIKSEAKRFHVYSRIRSGRMITGLHQNPSVQGRCLDPLSILAGYYGVSEGIKLESIVFDQARVQVLQGQVLDTFTVLEQLQVASVPAQVSIGSVETPTTTPTESTGVASPCACIANGSPVIELHQGISTCRSPYAGLCQRRFLPVVDAGRDVMGQPFGGDQLVDLVATSSVEK